MMLHALNPCLRSPMSRTTSLAIVLAMLVGSRTAAAQSLAELAEQVRAAETGFAGTMSRRDFAEFGQYLSDEAVFFSRQGPLRGKSAIAEGWKGFFTASTAPFSWTPEIVEVLPSGGLALTSGPVLDEAGHRIGTFNSIWRREADGRWRVVFDRGCPACDCSPPPAGASHD